MRELVIGKVLIVIGSSVAASVDLSFFSAYEVNKGAISRTGNGGSFSRICCSIKPPHQRESQSGSSLP